MGQEIFSILLVDDEKNERKGIEKLIQKNGYPLEIFQAENGIEALKIFKNRKIDILLTENGRWIMRTPLLWQIIVAQLTALTPPN